MKTLIIDGTNLAARFFYGMSPLIVRGERVEAVQGCLRAAHQFKRDFVTTDMVWCFDEGTPFRRREFPWYKNKAGCEARGFRMGSSKDKKYLTAQIALLKPVLRSIGFANVFSHDGCEADDVVARVAEGNELRKRGSIIVSTDQDFWQLLSPNTEWYDHRNHATVTEDTFRMKFGIAPWQWVYVKAMAGDRSDNIAGLAGVGEATAAKHVAGKLPKSLKSYKTIIEGSEVIKRNLMLVDLPHPLTPKQFPLRTNAVTNTKWINTLRELGIDKSRVRA